MLAINSTNSANRDAIIINCTRTNKYGEHYSCCRCAKCITTRHCVAFHFHRLPYLQ